MSHAKAHDYAVLALEHQLNSSFGSRVTEELILWSFRPLEPSLRLLLLLREKEKLQTAMGPRNHVLRLVIFSWVYPVTERHLF